MKSDDQFVAGGGRQFAGRPMTRLFAILSLFGFGFLIAASVALYRAGWPPDLFSGQFWLCVLLMVPEPVFIVLTVRFAFTEKSHPRPTDAHDIRKLY